MGVSRSRRHVTRVLYDPIRADLHESASPASQPHYLHSSGIVSPTVASGSNATEASVEKMTRQLSIMAHALHADIPWRKLCPEAIMMWTRRNNDNSAFPRSTVTQTHTHAHRISRLSTSGDPAIRRRAMAKRIPLNLGDYVIIQPDNEPDSLVVHGTVESRTWNIFTQDYQYGIAIPGRDGTPHDVVIAHDSEIWGVLDHHTDH
jgi:hypothetical protein